MPIYARKIPRVADSVGRRLPSGPSMPVNVINDLYSNYVALTFQQGYDTARAVDYEIRLEPSNFAEVAKAMIKADPKAATKAFASALCKLKFKD